MWDPNLVLESRSSIRKNATKGIWRGGRVKKVKGLRNTDCESQNSHRDVKCSTGNMVNNIIITTYGAR